MIVREVSTSKDLFSGMVRMGWVRPNGSTMQWFDHQRVDHDRQFEEPREYKSKKTKFSKHPKQEAR